MRLAHLEETPDIENKKEEIEMNEEVKSEQVEVTEFELTDLPKDVEDNLNKIDENIQILHKRAKTGWRNGFLSGYGTAVGGLAIGAAFVKWLNKLK